VTAIFTWFRRQTARRQAVLLGSLSLFPPLLWWLGWFPGFVSSDTVDQLGQVERSEFSNQHPAIHTILMWIVTRVWDHPGAISLIQVMLLAAVLAFLAGRLSELGLAPGWAGGLVVAIAALPAVSATTIAIWKDVPFTIALLWAFGETLGFAARPERWEQRWPPIRLGLAVGAVWLLRHNGFLTTVPFLATLVWLRRRKRSGVFPAAGAAGAVVVAVTLLLYPLMGVDRGSIEPATVFISDVAASYRHEPGNFDEAEVDYLASIAPLDVWRTGYDCHDSTPLVFSPEFDAEVIAADPGRFRRLVADTYLRDLDTVLGHRWCAASYLVVPWQPDDGYFHRPPFEIAPNDLGIVRRPISDRAYAVTLAVFRWAEPAGRLWLTWRPGLAIVGGLAVLAWMGWRRRLNGLGPGIALFGFQLANVAVTTPAEEFRFAFGLYVIGLLWIAVAVARLLPPGSRSKSTLRGR